jgi:hypothetical protein
MHHCVAMHAPYGLVSCRVARFSAAKTYLSLVFVHMCSWIVCQHTAARMPPYVKASPSRRTCGVAVHTLGRIVQACGAHRFSHAFIPV